MKSTYVISIIAENSLDVFQRLSNVFLRNRLLIDQFKFERSKQNFNTNFYIELEIDEIKVEKIVKQLSKIIELTTVKAKLKNHVKSINKEVYVCQN
ncbi:hypothetical protein [Fluviispira sanaruensis]|uniref:ACT domain-containing protein n=1 Tax=Fluviispira sanaruensis TaxID=2493639 RepID=A0A4P2VHR3_FLUSA|nr:hypothetical protein [Fluviispira sanaruensis]BBH52281.1 hypothetical protein JCM31447_07220 [Fluviispira sanaruensis]